MSLKERVYSVLVVSAAEGFNSALSPLLPEGKYSPVRFVASATAARRALAERSFDFVVVNSPLPDDTGTRLAVDAAALRNTVVLLMVRGELYEDVYDKVAEWGVFVLQKPTAKPVMTTALGWLASARERLRKLEKKTVSMEEKMEEIRLVNRAKWLLITHLQMEEAEAHRYIEKQAMDRCGAKRAVADEIIKTYA